MDTNMDKVPSTASQSEGLNMRLKTKDVLDVSNHVTSSQTICSESVEVGQGCYYGTQLFTGTNDLYHRQCFDTRLLRTNRLFTEEAGKHMRKLKQERRKLPSDGGTTRGRLAAFSEVFSDVCDGSAAFGSILREIKTEYDLYLTSLLSSHFTLQDMTECTSHGNITELEKAAMQVSSLQEKTRRALEENGRVRIEYEIVQTKVMENQKENDTGSHPGQSSLEAKKEDVRSGVKHSEESTVTQVETKRQQVWRLCMEVQKLQKEIKDTMVSTAITSDAESCITHSEDEIVRLIGSSERLRRYNKQLEQNILMVLNRANISEEVKEHTWKKISNTLNGDE